MTSSVPEWISNVPLKTVGVLCAVNIFGKNIESRQIAMAGKMYLHNAVENVVNYALNPILPDIQAVPETAGEERDGDASEALRNVRDCFNYIFHIQVEYFKLLQKVKPGSFRSRRTGKEFNLNQFAAKSPTLINSEKRYLILSKIDGAQPYDLDLDWNAEFDWIEEGIRDKFRERLVQAQDAYADTLNLSEWYNGRDRNLVIPLKTIMDDLSEYFVYLSHAAYFIALNSRRRRDSNVRLVRQNLLKACMHLERFTLDMSRISIFSIVKHDLERLGVDNIDAVIKARAEDESRAGQGEYGKLRDTYARILRRLYRAIEFEPVPAATSG